MRIEIQAEYNYGSRQVDIYIGDYPHAAISIPCGVPPCPDLDIDEAHSVKVAIMQWLEQVESMRVDDAPRRAAEDEARREQWWNS